MKPPPLEYGDAIELKVQLLADLSYISSEFSATTEKGNDEYPATTYIFPFNIAQAGPILAFCKLAFEVHEFPLIE